MKSIIVFFSIIIFGLNLHAQKPTILDKTHRHEIAVSIPSILSLAEDGLDVMYRYQLNKGALRFRLSRESSTDSERTPTQSFYTEDGTWGFEGGIEKHTWIKPRWMTFWGVALGYRQALKTTTIVPEDSTSQFLDFEQESELTDIIDPTLIFGVRYQVSPRVSFGSEINFRYSISFWTNAVQRQDDPIVILDKQRTAISDIDIPVSVYLQFTL